MTAGPPLSLRFKGRATDAACTFPAGMAVAAAAALAWKHFTSDVHIPLTLAAWVVVWALILLPVAWLRWRRCIRIDDAGVTLMRPRGRVLAELRWEEIEAYGQVGQSGVEVRGAGRTIRITDAFERLGEAWAWIRERCEERILGTLRLRLKRGESTELRTTVSRTRAQLLYLALTAGLAGVAVFYAWAFRRAPGHSRWGALIPLAVWTFLFWRIRRSVSGDGGWIRVTAEGVVVKQLDARWEPAWAELIRIAMLPPRGLCLERRAGAPVPVPPTLLNLGPLMRLVAERAGGASDSPVPG